MKRHSLSPILLSLFFTGSLCAAPVTRGDALLSARRFLQERGLPAHTLQEASTRSNPHDTNLPYHIFNIGENDGFVIIAGDDRAGTVLGYSLSGSLDPDNLPDACKAWLRQYSAEIESLPHPAGQDYATTTRAGESGSPEYPSTPVEPLLKSLWDQNAPYNLDCPKNPAESPYPTGCVATAVAQIMYYYGYPEKPKGYVAYEDKATDTFRTLDFSDYPAFEWEVMTPTYGIGASTASCVAVASLMKAVGYASHMQYGLTSIAHCTDAAKALINNFGYDPNVHKYERALTTDREWAGIILDELYAARPVLYDGYNAEGGHTFVCDGYDGNGFFHINWGWSGLSDGYYLLSALDPAHQATGGTSDGYNLRQMIHTRIAPPETTVSVPQTECMLDISSMHFHSENGFTAAGDDTTVTSLPNDDAYIFIYAYNKGFAELTGDICMAMIEGEEMTPVYTRQVYFLQPYGRADLRFWPIYSTLPDGSPLPEGTYRMGFFYRPDGAKSWYAMRTSYGTPTECKVTIASDRVIMSTAGIGDDTAVDTVTPDALSVTIQPGHIRVISPVELSAVTLYDMSGIARDNISSQGHEVEIPSGHLSPGIYILHILTADGRTSAVKVRL